MRGIQAGIIGLGGIGRQFLAEMLDHDRFTVAAAWDPSGAARAAATAASPGLAIAENAELIFRDPSINCVYIASPPQSHCDYVLAAVEAGKAIYCEKPLGVDLTRSREVAKRVANTGLPNIVNFNHARADRRDPQLAPPRVQSGAVVIRTCRFASVVKSSCDPG